jgi:hypothetical protein
MKVEEGSSSAVGKAEPAEIRVLPVRWKPIIIWTLAVCFGGAALLAIIAPTPAVALAVGGLCGLANAYDLKRSSERLLNRRNLVVFWSGGFVRIAIFGIVPVWIASKGPFWAFGIYFVGFFMPLALYALYSARDIQTEA